jgi:hypothetical protein
MERARLPLPEDRAPVVVFGIAGVAPAPVPVTLVRRSFDSFSRLVSVACFRPVRSFSFLYAKELPPPVHFRDHLTLVFVIFKPRGDVKPVFPLILSSFRFLVAPTELVPATGVAGRNAVGSYAFP